MSYKICRDALRYPVSQKSILVYDHHTDHVLGYLEDVSTTGFQMSGTQHLPEGVEYTLRIQLKPDGKDGPHSLVCAAEICWEDKDATGRRFCYGFHLTEESKKKSLKKMIESLFVPKAA